MLNSSDVINWYQSVESGAVVWLWLGLCSLHKSSVYLHAFLFELTGYSVCVWGGGIS